MSTDPDYLFEDPAVPNQKYVCISVLTPKNFKQEEGKPPVTISTMKVRGCYDSYEDAKKRADFLRGIDSNVNVYVGEVGKWLPFDDDPEHAKDHDYQNKRLNEMMKGYLENQEKAKEFHEQRKNDMIMKTLKENEEKDKRRKERQTRRDAGEEVDDDVEEKEFMKNQSQLLEQNVNQESNKVVNKKELSEKENLIKSKEKDIKENKAELQKTKEEVAKYQQKNEKIKKELEEAKRVFEEMMAASKSGSGGSGSVKTMGSM